MNIDDEKKTEEPEIEVVVSKQTTDDDNNPIEPAVSDDNNNEKEQIADNKDEIKDLEKEQQYAKTQKEKDRIQRRIDKINGENKDLKKRIAELEIALNAKPDDEKVLTEEDVERRSEEKATRKQIQREFISAVNRLAAAGIKADKEFKSKVDTMAEELGPIPSHMIGILDDLDNGGEVLSYMTNNIDDAEDIYKLNPTKMALRLAKISDKLESNKKKPIREISNAPKPNSDPVGGKQKISDNIELTGSETTEEYIRKRNEQERRKHEARFGSMRR